MGLAFAVFSPVYYHGVELPELLTNSQMNTLVQEEVVAAMSLESEVPSTMIEFHYVMLMCLLLSWFLVLDSQWLIPSIQLFSKL